MLDTYTGLQTLGIWFIISSVVIFIYLIFLGE